MAGNLIAGEPADIRIVTPEGQAPVVAFTTEGFLDDSLDPRSLRVIHLRSTADTSASMASPPGRVDRARQLDYRAALCF